MSSAGEFSIAAVVRAVRQASPPGMGDFAARQIATAALAAARQPAAGLSETDQNAIADAFAHALDNGAPGISVEIRRAIIVSAMIRVRHALAGGARR